MATVPHIVPVNDMPKSDTVELNIGYPCIRLMEKSAQAFDKAASDCMVRILTFKHSIYWARNVHSKNTIYIDGYNCIGTLRLGQTSFSAGRVV